MACCYEILVCRISICCNRNYYRGSFIMNQLNQFSYKNVLVLGLAKSGFATADVLLNNNINIIVNDLSTKRDDPLVKKDRKSTRLNSSHVAISYAVFCLKKKK